MPAFGAVGLVLVWFTLRNPPPAVKEGLPWIQKIRQLDLPVATLLLESTICLNLALQWGGIVYLWSDSKVFGCLIGFGLILIMFLYLQFRGKETLVSSLAIHTFRCIEAFSPDCSLTLPKFDCPSSHLPESYSICIMRLHDAGPNGYSTAIVLLANILLVGQEHYCQRFGDQSTPIDRIE